jgi:hypothetical protein
MTPWRTRRRPTERGSEHRERVDDRLELTERELTIDELVCEGAELAGGVGPG